MAIIERRIQVKCPGCGAPASGESGSCQNCRYCQIELNFPVVEDDVVDFRIPKTKVIRLASRELGERSRYGTHFSIYLNIQNMFYLDGGDLVQAKDKEKNKKKMRLAAVSAIERFEELLFDESREFDVDMAWGDALCLRHSKYDADPDYIFGYTYGLAMIYATRNLMNDPESAEANFHILDRILHGFSVER